MKLEPIDTSTTAGKRQVMEAWDNKRPVALQRYKEGEYQVLPADDEPAWDWPKNNYAIIAEQVGPDEVWVLLHKDGSILACSEHELRAADCQHAVRYRRVEE